jgi:heterotetrameric sarcosine oxidase gamma subunit
MDLTACVKLLLRGPVHIPLSEFLPSFGQARRVMSGRLIVAAIPEQWLLIGAPASLSSIQDWLNSYLNGSPIILTDLTHARVLLRLVGVQSAMLLSKVCAINFGAAAFPCGRAVRSSLAKVPCEIIRDDLPHTPADGSSGSPPAPSYLIICDRPVGAYIFDALLDAGGEYNIDTAGFSFD